MIGLLIGAGPLLVCVISPIFMVGRVEGDERAPIIRRRKAADDDR